MDELLIKYLLGEASPEEVARVERWLAADAANRVRYGQFKAVWGLGRRMAETASAAAFSSSGHRDAWRRSKQTVDQGTPVRRIILGRAAAVVIGLLVLGAASYFLFSKGPRSSQEAIARPVVTRPSSEAPAVVRSVAMPEESEAGGTAAKGLLWTAGAKPQRDTLPDGTVVTLNRGASLAVVARSGDKGLTVKLQGEAFFSVRHDPAKVFIVQSGMVSVRVLGTSFELKGSGDTVELVVEMGAVRASRRGVGGSVDSMIVRAGEQLLVTGSNGWIKTPSRDKLYGYYLGRPLICDSTPLRRVVSVVNEAYDAHLVLGRPELGDLPLTTQFRGQSPEKMAAVIAATFNLSIVRQGSSIILQ